MVSITLSVGAANCSTKYITSSGISFSFSRSGGREIGKKIQPIVEVFAEFTVLDHLPQVSIGGGNDANVRDFSGACQADWFELAFLENTEDLRLKFQRHVSNFIEKQRAAIRQREAAKVRIEGPRESSSLMSEKLTFEKTCRASRRS